MKQEICRVLIYMVLLYVTPVLSNNKWQSSKDNMRTSEGSGGGYLGSGPGTDDEDRKELPHARQPVSHFPESSLPEPTSETKLKRKQPNQKQLSGDEGSGRTPDTEHQLKDKRLIIFTTEKRKEAVTSIHKVPTCNEVTTSIRNKPDNIPYEPDCTDNGNYSPLQCYQSDCFCVNVKDGTIFEKTRTPKEEEEKNNFRCHWVRYRIQIPIPSEPLRVGYYKEKLMAEINKTASLLMGVNLFTFKKFIKHPSIGYPTGVELELRSIGLIENYPLRINLRKLLSKFYTTLGNLDHLNVTEVIGTTEVRQLGPGSGSGYSGGLKEESSGRLAGDEPREGHRVMRTADTSNAGKSGYSVRNGEDSKTPGDDPKQASGTSASKKSNEKKMATLFEQPGIIAAIIGGGIAAFLLAILLILFCIYRIRKKDEGSYALEEPKKTPVSAAVYHSAPTREYYA